jgi:transposase
MSLWVLSASKKETEPKPKQKKKLKPIDHIVNASLSRKSKQKKIRKINMFCEMLQTIKFCYTNFSEQSN